jgi:hypothetical protein
MPARKPTFGQAFALLGCGILMALFGCAGFLKLIDRSSVVGTIGGVMFGVGVLAAVVGAATIVGLAFVRVVNAFSRPPDRS